MQTYKESQFYFWGLGFQGPEFSPSAIPVFYNKPIVQVVCSQTVILVLVENKIQTLDNPLPLSEVRNYISFDYFD
jgi:hypothetical protein